MLLRPLLVLLACLSLFPVLAHGATYYVAKTGSDSNSCSKALSSSTPKLTITAGLGCLSAGDTLIVKAGVYPEVFDGVLPNGSAGNPITIQSETPLGAIIRPPFLNYNWFMVRMNNAHDIVLDGFKFDGTNQNYYGEGIEIGGASHDITIKNSEITMEGNTNGPGYQCPNGPCMLGMGTDYPAYNLLISHNKIHHLGPGGAYAIYFHSRDSTFEYNEVYNLDEYGVHFYATADHPEPTDRNVFRGNYIHDINGPCVLFASGGDSNTFYNNVLARCGLLNHRGTDGLQLGCYGDRASTNNTVYNNTFYGNAGNAIRVCGSGHKLQNNILFGNGADVMGLSGATNITMDHNLCPAANGGCTVVTSQSASQLFVNAASGDFHLVAGSAAIAQGIPIATVTTDIAGTPRRLGTPYDLGAYVYSSGPAPDPAPTALRVLAITP